MSSQDLKQALVDYYEFENIQTKPSDWKRTSKRSFNITHWDGSTSKCDIREFFCASKNLKMLVIGEDELEVCLEIGGLGDAVLYSIDTGPDYVSQGIGGCVCFCGESFWRRNGHIPDNHLEYIMTSLGLHYDFCEDMENCFSFPDTWTLQAVRDHLNGLGFKENPGM
jgi:hypothetical protein